LYANVYKHMNGDSTKDEKEYQDTICSEAEEGMVTDLEKYCTST